MGAEMLRDPVLPVIVLVVVALLLAMWF